MKLKPFSRDWNRHLKEKLGFAFSQTRLVKNFNLLRDFVQDLKDLCSPGIESLSASPSTDVISRDNFKDLELHRSIGDDSQEVFDSLQKASSKHIEHHAHLCVKVEEVNSRGTLTPQFKFKLAFASVSAESEPMWFSIETIMEEIMLDGKDEGEECDSKLKGALKRQISFPEATPERADRGRPKKKRMVRILVPQQVATRISLDRSYVHQNLINGDFCDYLRQSCSSSGQQSNIVERWKSLAYPFHEEVRPRHLEPKPLQEIISSSNGNYWGLTISQRLYLAKMISVAFLRHHSMHWGRSCWRSDRLLFFDIDMEADSKEKPLRLRHPHLNARVCDQTDSVSISHCGGIP